jgi:malate dehydrogenase (quinone)
VRIPASVRAADARSIHWNIVDKPLDVVLIGGGIMSATLGTLLHELQPEWRIRLFERLGEPAEESSNPWNNAGTGHSALCELNYSPEKADGSVDISSAIKVNEQFQITRQYWSHLIETGVLPEASAFINPTPHMSFVWGDKDVEYMRKRYALMKDHPLFPGMQYAEDAKTIRSWAPVLIPGRLKSQPIAATFSAAGTDVAVGALTNLLIDGLTADGADIERNTKVLSVKRQKDGLWRVKYRRLVGQTTHSVTARFVFVGAGGYALGLLQKSGIPEIKGFGGFPVSGEFLRTDNPAVVAQHRAKVYGKAQVGAPPMSVPHLDTRIVDGDASLMFGPYAGFSPKFLKSGSLLDLFASIRPHNLYPMIRAGLGNLSLVGYLLGQLTASKKAKFEALQEFFPEADPADWYRIIAGQRVQVIKKDAEKGGVLQFGTEVVASADGTIAGLLGASPGASTAAPIMLSVLEKCFPDRMGEWEPRIRAMVPTFGTALSDDPALAAATMQRTAKVLGIPA